MRKAALVTGASSGIGLAAAEMLAEEGYEVYGIGRSFADSEVNFIPLKCDLLNEKELRETLAKVPGTDLYLLVNNAGTAYYGMHETISPEKIREMTRTNLEIPMILTQYFLRDLRANKGDVINIASVTAGEASPHAAVYGATKAGLLHFSESLFAENRKFGVRVTTVLPDLTDTNLYRSADFTADTDEGCCLDPKDVSDALKYILHQREGTVVSSLTIRPQLHRIRRRK